MPLRGTVSNGLTTAGPSLSLNLAAITGLTLGDRIILELQSDGSGIGFTVSGSTFGATPNVANMNVASAEGTNTFGAQTRLADGTETSITITTGGSHFISATAWAFYGRAANPFVVAAATTGPVAVGGGSPQSLTLNGITALGGEDVLILVGGNSCATTSETWSLTAPTGFSNAITEQPAATAFASVIHSCCQLNVAPGVVAVSGGSISNTVGLGIAYGAFVIPLGQLLAAPTMYPLESTEYF